MKADPALNQLFKFYHFKEFFAEEETQEALTATLTSANVVECIQFLPVVLHALLRVMCSRTDGAKAMETLVGVLVRMSKELGTLHRTRQVSKRKY